MDAIEFTAWVADQAIPDDDVSQELTDAEREDAVDDLVSDMDDASLCNYLATLREIVKKAREVRDEALAGYDKDDGVEVIVSVGALKTVLPEDAAWLIETRERDA